MTITMVYHRIEKEITQSERVKGRLKKMKLPAASGFHAIYKSLENTEKIRILIGISTSRQTFELLERADKLEQRQIDFSHAEIKQEVENLVQKEMEESEDNRKVEEGVNK